MTIFPTRYPPSAASTPPSTGSGQPIFRAVERAGNDGAGSTGSGSVAADGFVVDWQLGTPASAGEQR